MIKRQNDPLQGQRNGCLLTFGVNDKNSRPELVPLDGERGSSMSKDMIGQSRLYRQIAQLGEEHGAGKIVLFGSRARGDHRPRSDVDIAVYGMPEPNQSAFQLGLEELPTLLQFDVVFVTDQTTPALMENIEKDGVPIMNKKDEKYRKLQEACKRLQEAINDFEKIGLESIRDGVIQRFEFCTELAWKTIREHLLDMGYTEINSPKAVMKTAFADGLLENEQAWLDMINDRNLTSHVYDEEQAARIYNHIRDIYCPLLVSVLEKLADQ